MQQNEVPLFEFAAPFDQPLASAPAPAVNQLQAPAAPGLGANHSGTGRNAGGSGSSAQGAGQGQSTSKKPSDRSLFISSLHPDAEFTHLHEVFDKFGKIISCRVLKDAKTGQSRCIGYVNFQEPADAQRAIEATHGKPGPVGGGPICVRYAEDDPAFVPEETKKLFIRYVPLELTVDDVRSAFAPYGTVTDCTIMPDTSTAGRGENELWNMAYVTYSTSEEATNACAKSHKSFLLGPRHELIVKPAETLATRAMRQRKHDGSQSNSTVASASNRTAGSQHVSSLNQNPSIMPIMTVPYPGAQMAMVHPGMAMQPPAVVAPPGFRVMYMPAPNGIMQPVMVPDTGFMPMMQPMMVPMMMAQPQGFVPMMVPQPAAFGAPPTSATE